MPVSELEVVRVSTAEFEGCLFCVHLIPYHVKTHPFLAHLAQLAQQWHHLDMSMLRSWISNPQDHQGFCSK